MKQKIIDFINEHETEIDDNEWIKLYSLLGLSCSWLTKIMHEAGIYPERYLTELPGNFYRGIKDTTITIPQNISQLNTWSLRGAEADTLIMEEGVKNIQERAMSDCHTFKVINLPSTIEHIGAGGLCGSKDLVINYNGTREEFRNIIESKYSLPMYYTIKCTDGILKKSR